LPFAGPPPTIGNLRNLTIFIEIVKNTRYI
jgi:hypothetical protein